VEGGKTRRRLAAILAADIVGYSRLIGADEEGTLARLRALRSELVDPTVRSHDGRIVKTSGDGLLIEFSSVIDAVTCAIELQRSMVKRNGDIPVAKRLEFRVGINLGDVVVESGDLLGEGVNIAARLEALAEPGGICLSAAVYDQIRDRVPVAFHDLGEQNFKNILRPVRAFHLERHDEAPPAGAGEPPPAGETGRPRYSILVLPFATLNGERTQEWFADALTDNLTTDLTHPAERIVISRNTALRYKGRVADVKQIGHDLGVRYVVEGTVQHGADRVRVNVQLVDVESGAHLWAERFDKSRGDPLAIQDEIAVRVTRELDVQLRDAEARRIARERSSTPSTADLTARAYALLSRGLAREISSGARDLLEHALKRDPYNVLALGALAVIVAGQQLAGWREKSAEETRHAAELAGRALALEPRHPLVLNARIWVLILEGKLASAIEAAGKLSEIEPVSGHGLMAYAKICDGHPRDAIAAAQKSLDLGPHDERFVSFNLMSLGIAHLSLGELERAISWFELSADKNPKLDWTHLYLASAYAQAGRLAEAAKAMERALALSSDWTSRKVDMLAVSRVPAARWQRILEGMQQAGLPQ
jgi:class 3 adenylate cyclase/TolB-like protein/Tfp pilus assembly protein PilF